MLSMKVDTLVAGIVRTELIEKGGHEDALYFNFDCGMGYSGYSYVTVFSAITESPFEKISGVKEWKFETHHDSCWRDIRVFSDVYFAMASEINRQLVARASESLLHGVLNEQEPVAPIEMTEHNSFSLFGKAYQFVPVKIDPDPDDKYGHRKIVKLLSDLERKLP